MAEELSAKEKLLLWGLVKYPMLNDRELSAKLKIKQSTLAFIKRKLRNENYYRTLRLPYLEKLGAELLIATYAKFISALSLNQRLKVSSRVQKAYSEIFYALSDPSQGISLQISKDYTTVKKWCEELEKIYSWHSVLSNTGVVILPFPFKLISFVNFFDFSPLLEELFELPKKEGIKLIKLDVKEEKFSSTERKVYYGLIKWPELNDKKLAEKLNISRATISALKRYFEGRVMKTIRVINLEKLNLRILAFLYFKFRSNLNENDRLKFTRAITKLRSPIFMVIGSNDALALMPLRDFNDYKKITNSFAEISDISDNLREEIVTLLFSIPESKVIKEYSFDELVMKFTRR